MPQKNKTIICVPTEEEKNGILSFLDQDFQPDIHVTGLGTWMTAYHILEIIHRESVGKIVHLGVAGAYRRDIQLGQVVEVVEESLIDAGAETDQEDFVRFHKIVPSITGQQMPWSQQVLINPAPTKDDDIKTVTGLTVPFTSGSIKTIHRRLACQKDIENMEGVGLFYACLMQGVAFSSIRAISNYVEPRNKDDWKLELAFKNLAQFLSNHRVEFL